MASQSPPAIIQATRSSQSAITASRYTLHCIDFQSRCGHNLVMHDAQWFALLWEGAKNAVAPAGMAARTILHIHLGLLIYLCIALLRKQGLRSPIALAILTLLAVANECADFAAHSPRIPRWLWIDSIADLVSTLLWPAVLFLVGHSFDAGGAAIACRSCHSSKPTDELENNESCHGDTVP